MSIGGDSIPFTTQAKASRMAIEEAVAVATADRPLAKREPAEPEPRVDIGDLAGLPGARRRFTRRPARRSTGRPLPMPRSTSHPRSGPRRTSWNATNAAGRWRGAGSFAPDGVAHHILPGGGRRLIDAIDQERSNIERFTGGGIDWRCGGGSSATSSRRHAPTKTPKRPCDRTGRARSSLRRSAPRSAPHPCAGCPRRTRRRARSAPSDRCAAG